MDLWKKENQIAILTEAGELIETRTLEGVVLDAPADD
jgi:hypothetical protein